MCKVCQEIQYSPSGKGESENYYRMISFIFFLGYPHIFRHAGNRRRWIH